MYLVTLSFLATLFILGQGCTDQKTIKCTPGFFPDPEYCPKGKAQCRPCPEGTYLPNNTTFGERCWARNSCPKNMIETAESMGDKTREVTCRCVEEGMIYFIDIGCFNKKKTAVTVSNTHNVELSSENKKSQDIPSWAIVLMVIGILLLCGCASIPVFVWRWWRRQANHDKFPNSNDPEATRPLNGVTVDVDKVNLVLTAAAENSEIDKDGIDKMKYDLVKVLSDQQLKALQRELFKDGSNDADNINNEEKGLQERIHISLKAWHEKNGDNATLRFLFDSLDKSGAKMHAENILKEMYDKDERVKQILDQQSH